MLEKSDDKIHQSVYPEYELSQKMYEDALSLRLGNIGLNKQCFMPLSGQLHKACTASIGSPSQQEDDLLTYCVRQCTHESCPIHSDVTSSHNTTQTTNGHDNVPEGFLCHELQKTVDINKYPFYKRSIEVFNSKPRSADFLEELFKPSYFWHKTQSKLQYNSEEPKNISKELERTDVNNNAENIIDSEPTLISQAAVSQVETGNDSNIPSFVPVSILNEHRASDMDITDLKLKYSFLFDPKYIFKYKENKPNIKTTFGHSCYHNIQQQVTPMSPDCGTVSTDAERMNADYFNTLLTLDGIKYDGTGSRINSSPQLDNLSNSVSPSPCIGRIRYSTDSPRKWNTPPLSSNGSPLSEQLSTSKFIYGSDSYSVDTPANKYRHIASDALIPNTELQTPRERLGTPKSLNLCGNSGPSTPCHTPQTCLTFDHWPSPQVNHSDMDHARRDIVAKSRVPSSRSQCYHQTTCKANDVERKHSIKRNALRNQRDRRRTKLHACGSESKSKCNLNSVFQSVRDKQYTSRSRADKNKSTRSGRYIARRSNDRRQRSRSSNRRQNTTEIIRISPSPPRRQYYSSASQLDRRYSSQSETRDKQKHVQSSKRRHNNQPLEDKCLLVSRDKNSENKRYKQRNWSPLPYYSVSDNTEFEFHSSRSKDMYSRRSSALPDTSESIFGRPLDPRLPDTSKSILGRSTSRDPRLSRSSQKQPYASDRKRFSQEIKRIQRFDDDDDEKLVSRSRDGSYFSQSYNKRSYERSSVTRRSNSRSHLATRSRSRSSITGLSY